MSDVSLIGALAGQMAGIEVSTVDGKKAIVPALALVSALGDMLSSATEAKQDTIIDLLTTANTRLTDIETAAESTDPALVELGQDEYETIAASQADQVLGATGAIGDYLAGLLIVPATTSPGAVSIKDGAGSAITVFTGGASSVPSLIPFPAAIGAKCTGAGWKVTTGANVSVFAVGKFT